MEVVDEETQVMNGAREEDSKMAMIDLVEERMKRCSVQKNKRPKRPLSPTWLAVGEQRRWLEYESESIRAGVDYDPHITKLKAMETESESSQIDSRSFRISWCKYVPGELEALFSDKVITDLGLCISVYDIESINGGFIFANEGSPIYTEKLYLQDLILRLGFFNGIYVPDLLLPDSSRAEPDIAHKKQVKWIWTFKGGQVQEYLIDGYDEIRFRVQSIEFPEIPKEQRDSKPFAPMEIIGSLVSDYGLGPISWRFWDKLVNEFPLFPAPEAYAKGDYELAKKLIKQGKNSSDEEDLNDVPDDDGYDTEDSFIDDNELDEYFQVDNSAIKHDGFFLNRWKLECTLVSLHIL
ncbi:hypothetical protein L1887_38831 [Cichorium endivia]|nr:hypothetical protein L1887_38831 [Cichorium endivia]